MQSPTQILLESGPQLHETMFEAGLVRVVGDVLVTSTDLLLTSLYSSYSFASRESPLLASTPLEYANLERRDPE